MIRLMGTCKGCKHYGNDYKNSGLCEAVGVMKMHGESIVDAISVFKKLKADPLEYRKAIVNHTFGCIYWQKA